ncbi:MAG: hypothetical protein HRT44_12140 [Bdellovibrionales bacterium]|nr:hypothetical protein [Bdellovibrionales bacterium]
MQDYKGEPLEIGETVTVISPNHRSPGGSLVTARITRFTPKMVGVKTAENLRERLVSYDKLAKL